MSRILDWKPCFFLALFLSCYNCYAQQDSLSAKELERITIKSSSNIPKQINTTSLQTLSGAQLQRLNSFSIADALRYFSGVQLKDYGGIGGLKTLNVRSMGSQQLAVFYDGLQLGNAQNGVVDLGKYSLDNIEEIELYNSQNPNIFQPARNFGSTAGLYIKAKQPVFEKDKKYNAGTAFKTGSFGLANPSAYFQQQVSKNITASLSTEIVKAHGKYKTRYTNGVYDTTVIRQNGDVNAARIETLVQDLNKDSLNHWKAHIYYYTSERGLPGAIVANRFYNPQRLWDKNFFAQSSFEHQFSNRYSILLQSKYANDYTRYLDTLIKKIGGAPLDNTYKQQEYYVTLANKLKLKSWWQISISTDYILNKMKSNLDNFAYPTRNTELIALASAMQWKKVAIDANLLSTFVSEKVKYGRVAENHREFTPAISASWKPFENVPLNIRTFYKRIFRMPTFNDLYYTLVGSTSLKPEYTNQYDFGIEHRKVFRNSSSGMVLQADVYYNNVENKIVAIPINTFRWTMINLDRVSIKGLDIHTTYFTTISQKFLINGILNYSFQKAVNKTSGQRSFDNQIPYAPVNSGSVAAQLMYKYWGVNYSFIYTGERYMLPENIPQNYIQPWYTHDLSFTRKVLLKNVQAVFSFEINNLLNQYYNVVINYPMPGRNYLGKLSFNL